ncbi:hypothetical protein SPI_08434 [Niveomyces insectorum RCEF 264]|uniref:Protein HGH1 homolog n=1 Tax=Niveomyces insectorum RCEF 264 TaxID=1081102 RepID=A0A167NAZ2_9HYPO|nr:hypothetical protein SPI_08434 [Niveomyces insectorum RCEF 264]
MPTELEELVGFIGHENPQIRLLATENLVPYSTEQPSIFKANQLEPVKHLKKLVADHPKIAEHALNILINLSADPDVLENLVTDDPFLDVLLSRLTNPAEPNANLLAMLLANLAKWPSFADALLARTQTTTPPPAELQSDGRALNQLIDLFVRGATGAYNPHANYDYLAYLFSDLAQHPAVRRHLVERQGYDGVYPLSKLHVFTDHPSAVRRQGVASTLKNAAFDVPVHPLLLDDAHDLHVLPYLLLPLAGNEAYDEDDMLAMLPDLQLLPPDKQRDPDPRILQTHVETLTLLTTTRPGRDRLRAVQVYPLLRETHLRVEDEDLREAVDRLVQVLMRDEAEGEEEVVVEEELPRVAEIKGDGADSEDEEDRIVEV